MTQSMYFLSKLKTILASDHFSSDAIMVYAMLHPFEFLTKGLALLHSDGAIRIERA
jgi:hypothetical protein